MKRVRPDAVATGLLAALALATAAARAQVPGLQSATQKTAEDVTRVRAIADASRVGPGQRFNVAVVFDLSPGWHTYWKNPGAGALPPTLAVTAPAGFRAGEVLWTRPAAFPTELGEAYGYEGQAVMFVPVTAPQRLDDGRARIEVEVRWAVCNPQKCVLGRVARTVEVETSAKAMPPPTREQIDPVLVKHLKRVPVPLAEAGGSVTFDGAVLRLTGPAGAATQAALFPAPSPGVTFGPPRIEIRAGRFEVQIDVETDMDNTLGERPTLAGLVALGNQPDDPCYEFSVPAAPPERRSP